MHDIHDYTVQGYWPTILVEMFLSETPGQDGTLQDYIDIITSTIDSKIVQKQSSDVKGKVK